MVIRRAQQHGFLLMDAIVATVILGIALSVILGLGSLAISSQSRGEQEQIAAMILDEQLELVLAVGPEQYEAVFESQGPAAAPFQNYIYDIEIETLGGRDPYRITATVTWQHAGRERSLSTQTLIAPRIGEDPDPDRRPQESLGRF
jgi:type II secretory pathway pseudopilin PulG